MLRTGCVLDEEVDQENADGQYGSLNIEECNLPLRCHDPQGPDILRTSKLAKNNVKSLSILQ
jgi:hypothetical protein